MRPLLIPITPNTHQISPNQNHHQHRPQRLLLTTTQTRLSELSQNKRLHIPLRPVSIHYTWWTRLGFIPSLRPAARDEFDMDGSGQCDETAIAAATDPIDRSIDQSSMVHGALTQCLELFVPACTLLLQVIIINHQSSLSHATNLSSTAVAADVIVPDLMHRCDRFDGTRHETRHQ
jgi:hypothetical protein